MSTLITATPALTTLSEDERLFQETVREFAAAELAPKVMEMDRAQAIDRALVGRLFELGLMGVEIPPELGGTGADFFTSVLVVEELSRVDPSAGVFADVQNTLVINALLRWATPAQQTEHLPRLAKDTVGAYALSEVGSGSDAFALQCRARQDGDGWKIDGRKMWITNGAEAGLFIVFATVDPDAGYKGITAFLVERDTPGFRVGKKEDKLGIRASSTCELLFDGVRVSGNAVLGQVGQGYKVATLASARKCSGSPRARSTTPSATSGRGSSSASRSGRSRASSSRSPRWPRRSRRPVSWCTTRPASSRRASPSS
jgi:alkylation response protein AidB-like acyl-CoA dehydrogenase